MQIYENIRIIAFNMPTIAFINKGFPEGGVARVTIDIARYCKKYAPEFKIVILGKRILSIPEDIKDLISGAYPGLDVYQNALKAGANLIVACSTTLKEAPEARKRGIKVIYANHGESFTDKYAIMSHRMQHKLLWHLLYRRKFQDGTLALRMAQERVVRNYLNSDAYVVLCEGYKQETLAVLPPEEGPRHILAINNPEYPVENPNLSKEKVILFSGRLNDYDKAPDRLMRIWAKVQDQLPEYTLEIVGDGPERANLEAQATELGLKNYRFEGWKRDVSPWYEKADILCLVSRTEGWPLCVSEALAHGVIPVAFNCSAGVNELLDGTGFPVPPADEDLFAETLVKAARLSEEKKLELRKKGIAKAASLDPDTICAKWVNLFREVLSK